MLGWSEPIITDFEKCDEGLSKKDVVFSDFKDNMEF